MGILLSYLPSHLRNTRITDMCHIQFDMVLRIWTQDLMFLQPTLYLLSHLPSSLFSFWDTGLLCSPGWPWTLILLSQHPKSWDYRSVPPVRTSIGFIPTVRYAFTSEVTFILNEPRTRIVKFEVLYTSLQNLYLTEKSSYKKHSNVEKNLLLYLNLSID